ncbi:MAG: tRNA1(Val) (adenine(37)-N6)-methyltransferase [Chitinophagales bacterium]
MIKPFQFKQFEVKQDKTAMKIGTDGVLLGAWTSHPDPQYILDIGTGTGVIALMMAQRFPKAKIIAIEIDDNAFTQAKENFAQSKWKDRLTAIHSSLQDFQSTIQFDLIVSNPPFFNQSFLPTEKNRATARHTAELSFEKLLLHTKKMMAKNGKAAFIIPYESSNSFQKLAESNKLYLHNWCKVKGNSASKFKRSLFSFEGQKTEDINDTKALVIEKERHQYTEEYKALVKDFYLKM